MTDTPVTIPDAKTMDGVNIHLGFIAKTLERLENTQKATDEKIGAIQSSFVPFNIFSEHLKADEDHETRIRANTTEIETVKLDIAEQVSKINVRLAWYIGGATGILGALQTAIGFYLAYNK